MIAFCEPCLIDLLRCYGLNITTSGAVGRRLAGEPLLIDDSKQRKKEERERKKQWKAQMAAEELEKMRDASADKW